MKAFEQIVNKVMEERGQMEEAIAKLERIKAQMLALLDEAAEVLMDFPGVSHLSYETWVARIETGLTD